MAPDCLGGRPGSGVAELIQELACRVTEKVEDSGGTPVVEGGDKTAAHFS